MKKLQNDATVLIVRMWWDNYVYLATLLELIHHKTTHVLPDQPPTLSHWIGIAHEVDQNEPGLVQHWSPATQLQPQLGIEMSAGPFQVVSTCGDGYVLPWMCHRMMMKLIVWSIFVCLCRYLAQILNETMRWAVIGPYAVRVHNTDIVITGHNIPAGVCFCLCQMQYVKGLQYAGLCLVKCKFFLILFSKSSSCGLYCSCYWQKHFVVHITSHNVWFFVKYCEVSK